MIPLAVSDHVEGGHTASELALLPEYAGTTSASRTTPAAGEELDRCVFPAFVPAGKEPRPLLPRALVRSTFSRARLVGNVAVSLRIRAGRATPDSYSQTSCAGSARAVRLANGNRYHGCGKTPPDPLFSRGVSARPSLGIRLFCTSDMVYPQDGLAGCTARRTSRCNSEPFAVL